MPGITGSADKAAELFAKGQLKPNFDEPKKIGLSISASEGITPKCAFIWSA